MTKIKFKNPATTVDIIVVKLNKILLVKRKYGPFKDMWALPGGFINYGKENLEQAAARELLEETGLKAIDLKLIGVYSESHRDPRGHVISHAYYATTHGEAKANDDAKELKYFSLYRLPKLAFDHKKIIKDYEKWENQQFAISEFYRLWDGR